MDSEIITDSRRINEEIENFYKSFLTSNMSQEDHMIDKEFDLFSAELHDQKLSDDEREELEYDVTIKGRAVNCSKRFNLNLTKLLAMTASRKNFTKRFSNW